MPDAVAAPPTAGPNTTPNPAPPANPIPHTEAPSDDMGSAFDDLDKLVEPSQASPEAPKEGQKQPQDAPKDQKPPETPPKDKNTPTEPVKVKAKTLAEAKEMAYKERDEWKSKYEALEKQSKTPKEDTAPQLKALQERAEQAEKRANEYLEKLKFKSYEDHPEYEEKYNKPFLSAFERGRKFVEQLEVVQRKDEATDQITQQGRKATAADFDAVARLYAFNPAEGSRLANQLFGEMSADVKDHIREAQRLFEAREGAKSEWRTKGSEATKAEIEQAQARSQAESQAYNQAYEEAATKYPDRFAPKEGDAKGNELLTKATDIALRAFTDGAPLKDGQKPLNGVEMARLRAAVVRQASAYPRERLWRMAAEAKITELEKKLEGFEASSPNGGEPKGRPAGIPAEDLESVANMLTPDYPTRR